MQQARKRAYEVSVGYVSDEEWVSPIAVMPVMDGNGNVHPPKHTAVDDGGDGWEEFFQYRELEMRVSKLEEILEVQKNAIGELTDIINSSQFIGTSDTFATYVPRNRRYQ